MSTQESARLIVVYLVERHPLGMDDDYPSFPWLGTEGNQKELGALIGEYDPAQVLVLVDEQSGGQSWRRMLADLLAERIQMVITHLAMLTPAQRQQLIGVCAQTGTQLITPSDAGRNRVLPSEPKTQPRRAETKSETPR